MSNCKRKKIQQQGRQTAGHTCRAGCLSLEIPLTVFVRWSYPPHGKFYFTRGRRGKASSIVCLDRHTTRSISRQTQILQNCVNKGRGERVAFSLLQMQISLVFHECAAHAKCKQRQHATQTVALCYLFPHTAQSSLHASGLVVELSSR